MHSEYSANEEQVLAQVALGKDKVYIDTQGSDLLQSSFHHLSLGAARKPSVMQPVPEESSRAPSPGAESLNSNSDDEASANSTDTESIEDATPASEFPSFEITPEIARRLSVIPPVREGPALHTLPTELHLEIFGYLDNIDSVCLGLAARNLYLVFRAIHGTKMPLTTRRTGPNKLESAWGIAGKQECKHCGMYRCELYRHIKTWMGDDVEYCAMKRNFGRKAATGSAEDCYRGKPSKPRRCGRHPLRTTSTHESDPNYAKI
ncbi:hypothetical protein F5884DRAFT_766354 [Xylogone sp. PMI_703]|nr:hypothetical protein F5884DRAFT_766354 [Xylogone sp. PMI_703]